MTATEPTPPQQAEADHNHRTLYWTLGAIAVILAIIGLFTYNGGPENRQAERKAQELTQKFEQAGLPVPAEQDMLVRLLGDDGGAVCANPLNALGKANLLDQLTNGANVGRRPVIIDRRVLQGELLILQTYCPDKAQDYQDKIDDLKTDSTIKN
jgi:hypothetical protein